MSEGRAVVTLALYSNEGKLLSGQQILALAHNGGWTKLDQLVQKGYIASYRSPQFLAMISVIMQRLKNELNEPRLADALKPYYNKWRKLIKTNLVENKMDSYVSRLPPEEPEEAEREEGQGPQEESDSSARETLR
ncbi:hypothetical protein H1R20_g9693, partial [Candolleomyces eurysporus]